MPAIITFDAVKGADFIPFMIEKMGFLNSMSGFYPAEITPGDTVWPMKEFLPTNMLYHPILDGADAARDAFKRAKFEGYDIGKTMGFTVVTPKWHVISDDNDIVYDNDKPAMTWDEYQERKQNGDFL